MTQWQPIETLPKDWKRILVFGVKTGELSGEAEHPDIWLCENEIGNGTFCIVGCDYYGAWVYNPTQWMPVSPPPATIEKGE